MKQMSFWFQRATVAVVLLKTRNSRDWPLFFNFSYFFSDRKWHLPRFFTNVIRDSISQSLKNNGYSRPSPGCALHEAGNA